MHALGKVYFPFLAIYHHTAHHGVYRHKTPHCVTSIMYASCLDNLLCYCMSRLDLSIYHIALHEFR